MTIKLKALMTAAAVLLFTSVAHAQCVLEQAMSQLEYYNINVNAEVAKGEIPILAEEKAIGEKAKNPDLPVGQQLPPQDVDRINDLNSQLAMLHARKMINSNYLRDARAIAKMAALAEAVRHGRTYSDNDPDIFYYRALLLAYVAGYGEEMTVNGIHRGECSVDAGLWSKESLVLKSFRTDEISAARERLTAIAQQYDIKMDSPDWIERIPSLATKKAARIDLLKVQDAMKLGDYVRMMETLRSLNATSVAVLNSDQEDIRVARDADDLRARLGKTWQAQLAASDEKTKKMDQILSVIGNAIPSDSMIETQELAEVAKQVR